MHMQKLLSNTIFGKKFLADQLEEEEENERWCMFFGEAASTFPSEWLPSTAQPKTSGASTMDLKRTPLHGMSMRTSITTSISPSSSDFIILILMMIVRPTSLELLLPECSLPTHFWGRITNPFSIIILQSLLVSSSSAKVRSDYILPIWWGPETLSYHP